MAQGIGLVLWTDFHGWFAALWILIPAPAAAWYLGSKAPRRQCGIAHLAIVAGLGGLAMLGGMWLDNWLDDGGKVGLHHAEHGFAEHGFMGFWNWSTAGMLAVCVLGCVWVARRSGGTGRARSWSCNLGGLVGMLVGMVLGGMWLAGPLTVALGSMFAAHHLAMVVGMTLGMVLGQQSVDLFEAALPVPSAATTGGPYQHIKEAEE